MYSTTRLEHHDVTLMFDNGGRLWTFRPTRTHAQAVAASITGTDLVLTIAAPGVQPGDMAVDLDGDVLEIRQHTTGATYTVGLPVNAEMHALETAYREDAFEVLVPTGPVAAEVPVLEAEAVAC